MNFGNIKWCDTANGLGVRVSLFVSGCHHHCKGCFNACTWDPNYGEPYTREVEDKIIARLKQSFISGLTLLGGEPFYPTNRQPLLDLVKRVKKECPGKSIWCYTGAEIEDLMPCGCEYDAVGYELLAYLDVLVDGPFKEDLKSLMIRFRGSTNQRIIDVQNTLRASNIVLKEELM